MIHHKITQKTSLEINESYEGITIEEKIRKIVENNEPITDSSPIIYTNRDDGVLPAYDIRTDRWDVAIDAMDKVNKTNIARRDEVPKTDETNKSEINEKNVDVGDKPIQATD